MWTKLLKMIILFSLLSQIQSALLEPISDTSCVSWIFQQALDVTSKKLKKMSSKKQRMLLSYRACLKYKKLLPMLHFIVLSHLATASSDLTAKLWNALKGLS